MQGWTLEETLSSSAGLNLSSLLEEFRGAIRRGLTAATPTSAAAGGALPESFSWLERGLSFRPGNQGGCNTCYAFVTTQLVSNLLELATGMDVGLSVQDILDCCTEPGCWFGNRGCTADLCGERLGLAVLCTVQPCGDVAGACWQCLKRSWTCLAP